MKKLNILAVIPARKGSKRVPNKNMQLINKKPLVYYTISEALRSKRITDVILSTDSKKILNYAKKFKNLNIPFLRPARLAKDRVESLPVVKHAMFYMEKIRNIKYDFIILLQPTCPMRKSLDIDNAINLILNKKADSVISITDVGSNHPFRMKKILKDGTLSNIFSNLKSENMKPIQKLKKFYIRNGAIYISKRDIVIKKRSLIGKKVLPYFMSPEKSINIDNFDDLLIARIKMK